MPVYSHSKLGTYENCPRKYKLQYIDRIELPEAGEGIEAFLGSRVHETLEKLHKELILTKLNSLEDQLDFYRDQWDRNWHENVRIVRLPDTFVVNLRAAYDFHAILRQHFKVIVDLFNLFNANTEMVRDRNVTSSTYERLAQNLSPRILRSDSS